MAKWDESEKRVQLTKLSSDRRKYLSQCAFVCITNIYICICILYMYIYTYLYIYSHPGVDREFTANPHYNGNMFDNSIFYHILSTSGWLCAYYYTISVYIYIYSNGNIDKNVPKKLLLWLYSQCKCRMHKPEKTHQNHQDLTTCLVFLFAVINSCLQCKSSWARAAVRSSRTLWCQTWLGNPNQWMVLIGKSWETMGNSSINGGL